MQLKLHGDRSSSEVWDLGGMKHLKVILQRFSAENTINQFITQKMTEFRSSAVFYAVEFRALGGKFREFFFISHMSNYNEQIIFLDGKC